MSEATWEYSKTRVRRAGRELRDFYAGNVDLVDLDRAAVARLGDAYQALSWYRGSFVTPLLKVRVGLTSFVRTVGIDNALLAQRLKRFPRIMLKLAREPSMQVTTMNDIGGCRVVVPGVVEARKLSRHITRRWGSQVKRQDDYIATPQPSGYRALHIAVERDERTIEIQIRTDLQHFWADHVEAVSRRLGHELKWGDGPAEVLSNLALFARVLEAVEDRPEQHGEVKRLIESVAQGLA